MDELRRLTGDIARELRRLGARIAPGDMLEVPLAAQGERERIDRLHTLLVGLRDLHRAPGIGRAVRLARVTEAILQEGQDAHTVWTRRGREDRYGTLGQRAVRVGRLLSAYQRLVAAHPDWEDTLVFATLGECYATITRKAGVKADAGRTKSGAALRKQLLTDLPLILPPGVRPTQALHAIRAEATRKATPRP